MKTSTASTVEITSSENHITVYDKQCKALLSDAQVISRILSISVEELNGMSFKEIIELLNHSPSSNQQIKTLSNETLFMDAGKNLFDIRIEIHIRNFCLYMNLEAQNKENPGYSVVGRGIYYCALMLAEQYNPEQLYESYDNLKKVYSIWLLPQSSKKEDGHIIKYQIEPTVITGEIKEEKSKYDKLNVVEIHTWVNHDINKKYEQYDEVLGPLTLLFTNKISNPEEKIRILEKEYGFEMNVEFKEEIKGMCTLGEGIYRSAKQEGIEQDRKDMIIAMNQDGLEIERIARIIRKPIEFVQQVIKDNLLNPTN